MKNMILIPEEQAAGMLNIRTCINTVREAYCACVRGEMYPGDRIAMPLTGDNSGQWLTAVCTKEPFFGFKFSAVFPGNPKIGMPTDQSTISLFSVANGEQVALIGANYLTALKTGSGAGVATDLLARAEACNLGIIGTGTQAFTQVLAIQEVRELKDLRIFDMSEERMNAFAERIAQVRNRPYEIIKCCDGNECVAGSDIVCTVTPSRKPVFDAEALQPGTHLNAIGSFTPFMQEVPEGAVQKASFVVTEHVDGLWAAAGDILIPYEKGLIDRSKVRGSIGDILMNQIPGRTDEQEITMYESIGSCVLDTAIAIAVYRKACADTEQ